MTTPESSSNATAAPVGAPTEWEETNVDATYGAYEKWMKERGRKFAKRPPQGRSVWRFLPPIKGTGGNPFRQVYVHFVRQQGNRDELIASGLCPSKTRNEPCVVCQKVSQLRRTGVKEDKEYADDLRAEFKIFANAVNLEDDNPEVTVMDVPMDVYKTLSDLLKDPTAGGDFTHPKKGYNIVIQRKGSGRNDTEYSAVPARQQTEIMNMAWLSKMNDLEAAAGALDTAMASALFSGKAIAPDQAASKGALPAGDQPAGEPPQDLVEDPVTGEWVPRNPKT